MDLRTTSISESMHASLKSGFDGVRAGMDTTSSANAVVGKSARRQKEKQLLNARDQERTVKWSELPTIRHLTEYCLMKAKEEWNVAETLVVVRTNMDLGEWWVYKEHHPVGRVTAPPGYTRLRRVKVVHQNFLWCSCGLPSRMNYPCQHIYAVTKQVSMNMFGMSLRETTEAAKNEGMDFLMQQPESWLSMQEDNNTLVTQCKQLHELIISVSIVSVVTTCVSDLPGSVLVLKVSVIIIVLVFASVLQQETIFVSALFVLRCA
ncbi:SWIM zinc finger domain protein [Nitzschia inconspicua]|uniref:SWIM zinc finger domain protein n=1 Tax=Nitzschia inconspicua TaxID=303405 RepID=A0A9K3PSE2_9STRA|nr:SWIM zinc finger domain protein [Nitzschia inconspicua]